MPAAAEFCAFDGGRAEIVVRRLKGPSCTMENALVFGSAANDNRYGADENKRTLGKAVLLGPQVWKFNGSCDTFKSRFQSKKASLGEKPSHEDVFEAMGAERISMGDLAERLVEGKK